MATRPMTKPWREQGGRPSHPSSFLSNLSICPALGQTHQPNREQATNHQLWQWLLQGPDPPRAGEVRLCGEPWKQSQDGDSSPQLLVSSTCGFFPEAFGFLVAWFCSKEVGWEREAGPATRRADCCSCAGASSLRGPAFPRVFCTH